nr:ABC transporter ATP-binding protein [Nocardiopsis mwathae]
MVVLFLLALVADLLGPQLLGHLVESVEDGTTATRVDLIALAFVGVLLAQTLLGRLARMRAVVLGEKALAHARGGYVRKVVGLPMSTVESVDPGDLLSRSTADVEKLGESVRFALPEILMALLTAALTIVAMVLTSPLLALVMLISLPPLVIGVRWYRRRAARAYERLLADWAEVQASMHETAHGAETVEALGLAERRIAHGARALARAERTQRHTVNLQTWFLPVLDLSTFVPLAAMLLIGGVAYINGLVGLAALTAMVLYVERLADPLAELVEWMDELQLGNAALRRILGVEQVPTESGTGAPLPEGSALALRDIHFGYRPGAEVLHGVDLDVAEGEFLVVVGPSGSGKSTLAKLITGTYAPGSGTATVGGVPIADIPAERLRSRIAMVTQEQHIFAGTIRDNLTLGDELDGAQAESDERLWDVLRAVEADGWVRSCRNGLDTEVGSGRTQVPPAVAQQLALARILLVDPRVLVLDEATSEMDLSASRRIERSFAALLGGRTVIAIAHRMDIALLGDRVLVLDDGRVAEHGRHDDLLAADGRYADLWKSWTTAADRSAVGG